MTIHVQSSLEPLHTYLNRVYPKTLYQLRFEEHPRTFIEMHFSSSILHIGFLYYESMTF